jgi:hypothetical protein
MLRGDLWLPSLARALQMCPSVPAGITKESEAVCPSPEVCSAMGTDWLPDELLEELNPHPDVHGLFSHYNDIYFDGVLGACSVEWSSARMTM